MKANPFPLVPDRFSADFILIYPYINLSYYNGKTPKKVWGPKKICGLVERPSKLGRRKILEP